MEDKGILVAWALLVQWVQVDVIDALLVLFDTITLPFRMFLGLFFPDY